MAITKSVDVDIDEICREFGIPKEKFIQLINQPELVNQQNVIASHTIAEVIDEFMKCYKMKYKKATTTKTYYSYFLQRFKTYILDQNSSMDISKLNETVFEDFLDSCKSRSGARVTSGTINTYQAILRALLRFAYDNDYVNKDLRYRFEKEKGKLLPRYLQDEQVEKVLEVAIQRTYGYLWRTIVFFFLGTGCRVSELVKIKVKDVDMDNNYIYVIGKGNKERYIPLYPEVKQVILKFLQMTGVKEWNKTISGFLFTKEFGIQREKPISVRSVQYQVQNMFKELGIDKEFTVHSFRHTFAVNCIKSGVKLNVLSQILGHENPETTSIYTQMFPSDLVEEVMKHYPFPLEKILYNIFGMEVRNE